MTKIEKVIAGMEWALENMIDPINEFRFAGYDGPALLMNVPIIQDAIALLKAQNEVIEALLKVGYPHNFQREEPWIVNYMYAITEVVKKAVNLE